VNAKITLSFLTYSYFERKLKQKATLSVKLKKEDVKTGDQYSPFLNSINFAL